MAKSSSIDIKLEVMEVQSSDVEIKLGGVMTATKDSSPIDIKIGGTPMTNNEKPKFESLWSNLPGDVLISIVERLCYVHQIYFLAVCKDWRSKIYGLVRHSDKSPWILAASNDEDTPPWKFVSNSNQCYLYDPIHKQKYTIENQILDGAHIHASKFDWLLLSTNIKSTYFFSFYSPFTNKVIELPALDMEISSGKIFTDVRATFSTAPTSSDCVICVVSTEPPKKEVSFIHSFFEEFCVSSCSPGGKTWNNVLLGTNGDRYCTWINSRIAHLDGVIYFTFIDVDSMWGVMGAFKPGLQEWKEYSYPIFSFAWCIDCLIESEEDENMFMLYYNGGRKTWNVCRFNKAEENWCVLENLGNRMLFVSAISTSFQLARSAKEDGEGIGSFENTIHVAYCYPGLECSSFFHKTLDKHPSCPQIYNWIDKEGLSFTWIQPPNMNF
ncbi:hypothetical protein EZV62_006785 [Acer yangbiense]|uniref:Uncharacterized protein n=1 Tax=Acer yangbiense TaxID=1000413 RepID=A0A5C7I837_9ROSI|nr:hypothetical protein EZV62_006785 [Acer yangbiense]